MLLTHSPTPTPAADRRAVLDLADGVVAAGEAPPLNEQTRLALAGVDSDRRVLLVRDDDQTLIAAAAVDPATATVEVVLPPGADAALDVLLAALGEGRDGDELLLWAHGERAGVSRALAGRGLSVARELLQLRRPFDAGNPAPAVGPPPDGVGLRTFSPGADEAAWLALNALTFASHPEQGRWQPDDLSGREAESWFDPAGFFLAERDGRLVGYHWTKVHHELTPPAGEVYVVGIHPDEQGHGLGSWLTAVGLRHLADAGLASVLLYVEADNVAAVTVYEKLGFQPYDVDICYRL